MFQDPGEIPRLFVFRLIEAGGSVSRLLTVIARDLMQRASAITAVD